MGNLCDCNSLPPHKSIRVAYKGASTDPSGVNEKQQHESAPPKYSVVEHLSTTKEIWRAENPNFVYISQGNIAETYPGDERRVKQNFKTEPTASAEAIQRWAILQNEASELLVQSRYEESLKRYQEALQLLLSTLDDEKHPNVPQQCIILGSCIGTAATTKTRLAAFVPPPIYTAG